jgi:hypothetical protein
MKVWLILIPRNRSSFEFQEFEVAFLVDQIFPAANGHRLRHRIRGVHCQAEPMMWIESAVSPA